MGLCSQFRMLTEVFKNQGVVGDYRLKGMKLRLREHGGIANALRTATGTYVEYLLHPGTGEEAAEEGSVWCAHMR